MGAEKAEEGCCFAASRRGHQGCVPGRGRRHLWEQVCRGAALNGHMCPHPCVSMLAGHLVKGAAVGEGFPAVFVLLAPCGLRLTVKNEQ